MAILFTADTHFGHENVIRYCRRPYADVAAMNEALIANWNAVVGPDDDVWHLGDFARDMQPDELQDVFWRLNGRKRLVLGNHDRHATRSLPWVEPPTNFARTEVDGQTIVMCHYGLRVWPGRGRGGIALYGHSHGRLPGNAQSLDVGVDCWRYAPVELGAIRQRLATLPPLPHVETDPRPVNGDPAWSD